MGLNLLSVISSLRWEPRIVPGRLMLCSDPFWHLRSGTLIEWPGVMPDGYFGLVCQKHAAAHHLVLFFQDNFYGFGIDSVLFLENSGAERFFRFIFFAGDDSLFYD